MSILKNIRRDYKHSELSEFTVQSDPFLQFRDWLDEAIKAKLPDPTAMTLSTVSPEGKPCSRIVLLKHASGYGFDFFSNYNSKKGKHLASNPFAALLFYWPQFERQVRIEGKVTRLSAKESDEYFFMRPVESRISTWASPQSTIVANRKTLKDWYEEFEDIFKTNALTRPQHWGGYRLEPDLFEFWQGRENRMHDRIEFVKEGEKWVSHRLAP